MRTSIGMLLLDYFYNPTPFPPPMKWKNNRMADNQVCHYKYGFSQWFFINSLNNECWKTIMAASKRYYWNNDHTCEVVFYSSDYTSIRLITSWWIKKYYDIKTFTLVWFVFLYLKPSLLNTMNYICITIINIIQYI